MVSHLYFIMVSDQRQLKGSQVLTLNFYDTPASLYQKNYAT
jgi:hypothetical protein